MNNDNVSDKDTTEEVTTDEVVDAEFTVLEGESEDLERFNIIEAYHDVKQYECILGGVVRRLKFLFTQEVISQDIHDAILQRIQHEHTLSVERESYKLDKHITDQQRREVAVNIVLLKEDAEDRE